MYDECGVRVFGKSCFILTSVCISEFIVSWVFLFLMSCANHCHTIVWSYFLCRLRAYVPVGPRILLFFNVDLVWQGTKTLCLVFVLCGIPLFTFQDGLVQTTKLRLIYSLNPVTCFCNTISYHYVALTLLTLGFLLHWQLDYNAGTPIIWFWPKLALSLGSSFCTHYLHINSIWRNKRRFKLAVDC